MFDWQLFTKRSMAKIAEAHSKKRNFTGHLECRVCYRQSIARRASIRMLDCPVLNRDLVTDQSRLLFPADIIRGKESELPKDGFANEDSEISVVYHFFQGSVVDTRTELIQHI